MCAQFVETPSLKGQTHTEEFCDPRNTPPSHAQNACLPKNIDFRLEGLREAMPGRNICSGWEAECQTRRRHQHHEMFFFFAGSLGRRDAWCVSDLYMQRFRLSAVPPRRRVGQHFSLGRSSLGFAVGRCRGASGFR